MRNLTEYPITMQEVNEALDKAIAERSAPVAPIGGPELFIFITVKDFLNKHMQEFEEFLKTQKG